jgi:hypothetical protein
MSEEKVLTKAITEQFFADEDSVDLSEFTAIEDAAAEYIGLLSVHPFFVQNYTVADYVWQHEGLLFDLSGLPTLAPNTLELLRPQLKDLAAAFSDILITTVEEIQDSGNYWLTQTEGIAVSGYNALFGPFRHSPLYGSDDCVFIAKDTVSGNDVFGNALEVKTLYYTIHRNLFDDQSDDVDVKVYITDNMTCEQCIQALISECPVSCDSVSFDGDGHGDAGFYIPVARLCECLRRAQWPHAGQHSLKLALKEIDCEQASVIAAREGAVYLGDDLESISEECAGILADGLADPRFYWTSIQNTPNHVKLITRWGDQDNRLELYAATISDELAENIFEIGKFYAAVILGEVDNLSDTAIRSLVRIQGELGLGLSSLTASQAEILCQHNAELSFYEQLTEISEDAAKLLSAFPYGLSLDLSILPESAAAILRTHPSFAEDDEEDWDDEDE